MTSPSTGRQTADDRSTVRAIVDDARSDPVTVLLTILLGAVTFLIGTVVTVFAMQMALWDALRRDFTETVTGETTIAVTPFDVIFLQVKVALLVGFVLALEVVVLRWWWSRSALPRWTRLAVALVGAALLPAGVVLGYEFLFPVVFEVIVGDGWVSILRWVSLACNVSIATGVAAQLVFAGGVRGLARVGRDGAGADES